MFVPDTSHRPSEQPYDARNLVADLRRLDPALCALIDARLACEACSNPKHEWHGRPHGGPCQTWPFASADAYANSVDLAKATQDALSAAEALIVNVAAAAVEFDGRLDSAHLTTKDVDAILDALYERFAETILEPLLAATREA